MAWYWVVLIAWVVGLVAFGVGFYVHAWAYNAYNEDESLGIQEWQQEKYYVGGAIEKHTTP